MARQHQSRPSRRSQPRSGAAAVEFAVVSPLIFLFVFASIEFGRVLTVLHGLESAAREGCRAAVSWDTTSTQVRQTVADSLAAFRIRSYTLTITPDPPTTACQWQPITVQVQVAYDQVSWLPLPRFLRGIRLTGSCVLPQESDHCRS